MLNDSETRFQMARNARMLAMKFSPETVSRRLIEAYRNLRKNTAPPPELAGTRGSVCSAALSRNGS
jgi:hypothetical protein